MDAVVVRDQPEAAFTAAQSPVSRVILRSQPQFPFLQFELWWKPAGDCSPKSHDPHVVMCCGANT